MSKMSKTVKESRMKESTKQVTNFMGGNSYKWGSLDTLKMITASSIFGEPQYYRQGAFEQKGVKDGIYRVHKLAREHSLLSSKYEGLTTSDVMEKAIDEALSENFLETLEWAKTLRSDFYMRLNPQVIMVRASMHEGRKAFTEKHPGVFNTINQKVMSRADEPASQLTYFLFKNKNKSGISSILKRSWKNKIENLSRFEMAKYKNAGVGLIDTIRISHAKGTLVDELMQTGSVSFEEGKETWEKLRSEGKNWSEILKSAKLSHMALLRNLRGIFSEIEDSTLCNTLMDDLKKGVLKGKQFPFRYFTALKIIHESNVFHKALILDALEECIDISRDSLPKLKGKTISLSDNSGSAWGTFNSEFGSMTVAEIDNLSSILTAQNSDEGYVGVFGDRLEIVPVSKRNGALSQASALKSIGDRIGMGTENGIWLFFDEAIKKNEHYDNIFIYSDQQAGHGELYGTDPSAYKEFATGSSGWGREYIDVLKLARTYRENVNPKVNIFMVQTAGYNNVVIPEYQYRTNLLYGWTGKETLFAKEMISFWDEKDEKKEKES